MLDDPSMDEGQPILASPHFYWSSCSVCYKPSTKSNPMKRCTRCQAIYYCGPVHQKAHWKKHKTLCNYISSAADMGGVSNFFSGHEGKSKSEWNLFRMNAVKTCSIMLARELEMPEQEMFLFPRVCRFPKCYSSGSTEIQLQDCPSCYCVSWCSDIHKDEMSKQHLEVCRELRLARVADRYESQVKVGLPSLPCNVDKKFLGSAPDITHFIEKPIITKEEITHEDLEFAFLTNQLSGPLTLLDVATRFLPDLSSRLSLSVHVVGSSLYEMIGIIKWEYLAHRIPNITEMNFVFIGPELEHEGHDSVPIPQCDQCSSLGRTISYKTYSTTYEEMKKVDQDIPDMVLVQNCGFSEHPPALHENSDWLSGWAGLKHLLHPNVVVAFTSYTRGESEADLLRFTEYCDKEIEILVECEENTMRSHRPIRDWEQDCNKDVFYSNHFISVVKQSR